MLIFSLAFLQAIIFVGMILMLRRIMNKNVISATRHLDELSQEYAKKEQELNRQLQEANQKSQELLKQAQEEAQKLKDKIIKEAQDEKENIIKQARAQSEEIIQQADKSRQALLREIEERITKTAVDKACELIQYTLPEQFKRDAHDQWVEELIEHGFGQIERLHLPQDISEIKITSAFALNEQQRKLLSKKIGDVLGREFTIKEEIEPKVVAGLVIHIGSLVLDGSLRNKIQQQAKTLKTQNNE
ncbi:MAG: F0F1 ATP synthase subunit delta [Candidatus Omnitrophica bacterium]|nr:F0F1 ATP synthase subunit delta [Candidatus Omnitrophota bacterium]